MATRLMKPNKRKALSPEGKCVAQMTSFRRHDAAMFPHSCVCT